MESVQIKVSPNIIKDAKAANGIESNKLPIEFPLARTLPVINGNADTFDYDKTKKTYSTVIGGYINLEHEGWINVGVITEASFAERESDKEPGVIECKGVLWKNVLNEFGITVEDIENGTYQISMEVRFLDYAMLVGDKRIELPDAREYEEYRNDMYDGLPVSRVIYPEEFSGAALTTNAADDTLDITKAVANKLKGKGLDKERLIELMQANINNEEDEDMFKQFETEEEFNEFLEDQKKAFASELKEDEEFVNDIRKGYMKVEEVLASFEDAGIEDIEEIDDVVEKFNEVKSEFASFQEKVENERLLNERKDKLSKANIDLEKIEATEEDILEMSDKAFNFMVKASQESAKNASASNEEDNDTEPFDPTNIDISDEDEDISTIIKGL